METLRKSAAVYVRIARTYVGWAPSLLALAVIIFVPLGFLDALASHFDATDLKLDSGVKVAALVAAVSAIVATSLLGEVFYSGVVAISLTHPHGERPPRLREVARRIDYRRLIAVDIVYVVLVVIGLAFFIVPGVLAFVFLALAGPVIEIEHHTVRSALRRSFQLVRGGFWLVALILIPIEIVGEAIGGALESLVHTLLGESLLASWVAESLGAIALTPLFAIAAVLLTLDLIVARDGTGPRLRRPPAAGETMRV